ncbi:hypothetical protein BLNAU_16416 [Blattamonas nauphoetae]|uniref:Uncharacterized protein n=1 Tax=Blattamonas nauphoetae TaxID=2049346 RepID=A0ABQ9XBQ8_9EUKA|nr:hypothetical protein BLNAU_16416 [Blattamonas nauphoetae]
MSSDSPNQDIRCAVLAASTIHVAFCELFWTDLKSIFVLRSSSPSTQTSSSITLAWCTLSNLVHHLTPIVEDMRTDSTEDPFNMNMVGTRMENMKVVGADGVCVSQTNHRNDLTSFAGISTMVSELRIMNVSSQPEEVQKVSSLFSQRMVGCAMWGSNNHLSGSLLRDLNGGGSFLCANSSFDWCHTTSSERPSLVSEPSPSIDSHSATRCISTSAEPENYSNDQYSDKVFDGVDRINVTNVAVTFTRCHFSNMKYTATSSSVDKAGGSALSFSLSTNPASIISCSFSKCSVASWSAVYGGCIFMTSLTTSTNTVHNCSFADWYPSNDTNTNQNGGGIGTYRTSAPLQITDSNFTLSGETTNTNNGGFFSSYSSSVGQSIAISNCRLSGDSTTTGTCIYLYVSKNISGSLSVTDSQIINTNSTVRHTNLKFMPLSGFTRTEIHDTAIQFTYASSDTRPFLFVDCKFNQSSIDSATSPVMYLFLEASFTGKPARTTSSLIGLSYTDNVVLHKCDFTDCSPTSAGYVIKSFSLPSLIVDTCSFTRCSGGKSIVDVVYSSSSFYFCSFTNVSGTNARVISLFLNSANFFESCRFDLEETTDLLDFDVTSGDLTCLNDTAVTGCTSNRRMSFGTWWKDRQELTAVQVVPVEAEKNEMRVGTWLPEPEENPQPPIPTFSSRSEALATLQPSSPPTNIVTFSDGSFTEADRLEVLQHVEIVGAGWNISDIHSTQLTTDGFVSKSACKLSLRSLRLVPLSSSSILVSTSDSGCLIVLNIEVKDISDHSAALFMFTAGSSEIRHCSFKNIESTESLISVSQASSLVITNTLFVTITRSSPTPTPVETTQCASCIEGKTDGEVKVLYCRFGACTTNGRAGAIDLENNDENSAVEMSYCYFDQNSGGTDVPDAVRGDNVVLKSFADSKTLLNFSTIQSFPSLFSFLINSNHPIVPPPAIISITETGVDVPLTWTYQDSRVPKSFLETYPLQFLLESRLRNNTKTELKTDFSYSETMTPFIFQNSTVYVDLRAQSQSIITVEQQGKVFVTLQKAYLSFKSLQFAFEKLTMTAFQCDQDSSIVLSWTGVNFTPPTLTSPFINSTGPYVCIEYDDFLQPITLDNTPFIRLVRAEKDAEIEFRSTTPLLASSLNTPFIVCEGVKEFSMRYLEISSSNLNSASFISAKDSTLHLLYIQIQTLQSTVQGAFIHNDNGTIHFDTEHDSLSTASLCSAAQGGVLFSRDSSVSMNGWIFSNCEAEDGGVAYVVTSTLSITDTSFISNSAKSGGAFWVDFGTNSASSLSLTSSTFTANTASDVDENGDDCGKGGAIIVKGKTTSWTPLVLNNSHFEENTAAFGNDVFVEQSVLRGANPNVLSNCGGESYSNFPHLEIENHNRDDDELTRISNFIPFPSVRVSSSGSDVDTCRWSNAYCQTIHYALQFLQTANPDGSLFQRQCLQNSSSMITEPVELDEHDLIYVSYSSKSTYVYSLSLSTTDEAEEGVVFTINDASRLTIQRIRFPLTRLHRVVKVDSKEGLLTMEKCFVLIESDSTTSISPISSVGSSLIMNTVSFSPNLTASPATLSAPLVVFSPTLLGDAELGSGSFDVTNCSLANLTFEGTTMFRIETSDRVGFVLQSISQVSTDLTQGKYICLKGQSFKQQIQPSLWHSNPTASDLPYFIGEDVSMDENDKWRTGSLVYWLVSPEEEILIGSDVNAVDHPNCGSSTFQCTTLDSAILSADLNDVSTFALSASTSLSSTLLATSSWLFKSSSATKRGVEFDRNGSIEIANSTTKLSFTSIIFTVAETCVSDTLFVVEEGDLSFSSCQFGGTSSESALILPASTTTLIEVKASGKLTLMDTLIQHITFSHATLGPAIRLHLDSTDSFSGTPNGDNTLLVTGDGESSPTFLHSGEIDSPLIVQTCGSLAVSDIHFSILEAQATTPRSASFFSVCGGSFSLTSVSFLAMSFSGSNSLIKLTGAASLTLTTIEFSGMTTEGSGSVIHSTSTGTITVSSVSFSSCNCGSSQKGRSVFIERSFVKDCVSLTSVLISSTGTVGTHDIFLTGSNVASTVTQSWESLIGSEDSLTSAVIDRIVGEEKGSVVKSGPLAYLLYPHTEGSVFIDESFWDHESCGKEKLPCRTFEHAHSKLTTSNQKVVFSTSCTLSGEVNSLPLGSVLSTKPDQIVSTGQTTQFVVQAGPLSFEAIHILLPTIITKPLFVVRANVLSFASSVRINNTPSPSTHQASLVSLSSGTLQMTGTQLVFQPTFVLTKSLIEQTSGNLELNDVCVQHISKSSGDGSVLHSTLSSTSDAIQITGTSSFKDCHSTVGNGGALFISCPQSLPPSSLVVDATFTECSCGPAMKGEWVFVSGHTFKNLLSPDCWTDTIAGLTWNSANSLWGTDYSSSPVSTIVHHHPIL